MDVGVLRSFVAAYAAGGILALLAACATPADPVLRQARDHAAAGRGEQALAVLDQASREYPGQPEYRTEYFRTRELLVAQWLAQAELLRSGRPEVAAELYRRVLKHNPQHARARAGLAQLDADERHRALIAQAEELVRAGKHREAQDLLRPVLVEAPQSRDARRLQRRIDDKLVKPASVSAQLKPANAGPVSLEMRDVTLRSLFEVLQRASGINFVFDRDVRADQRSSVSLRDAAVEDAIRQLLLTHQLDQKVINETTVFIHPNTPQKQREYQELVVKAFYLANADVRQTANMIRTLVKTRDIFIEERIGLLVLKDTPSAIRLAEP